MDKLNEIIYTIAAKGGKDEDDSFLAMLEPLVHQVRLKLIKQHTDRYGVLPWMMQTVRIPLGKSELCMSYLEEMVSTIKLPRTMRCNKGHFVRNLFLGNGNAVMMVQEEDEPTYANLRPAPLRSFLRNDRIVLRGNSKIKEIRIRDVFENPMEIVGMCCDPIIDYPIHDDMVPTLIQMVEQLVYNDVDNPGDTIEARREAGM